jgi:hypothetical protein
VEWTANDEKVQFEPSLRYHIITMDINQYFGSMNRVLEVGPQTAKLWDTVFLLLNRLREAFREHMKQTREGH